MSDKNIIASVGVLALKDGHVLLVRELEGSGHISGMCGLPSGRVDEGETEQETAAREFQEETGLSASLSDFKEFEGNYFIADIPRKDGTVRTFGWRGFRVQNFYGELRKTSDTEPFWVDLETLKKMDQEKLLLPNVLNAVNNALK